MTSQDHAALSHQAEPSTTEAYTALDMASQSAQAFRDGMEAAKAEPAPAQDEKAAFDDWYPLGCPGAGVTAQLSALAGFRAGAAWQRARPAQTEQQPIPEGWLIEMGFDVLDKPFRFVDSKSHTPTVKVILPACEPEDSSSWDLRDEIARRISSLLAAPIAQTASQSEFGDAYQGAREDLAIWKRRALEAEQKVRQQEQIIDHLTLETQGETRMGEPVIPQTAPQPEQSGLVEALDWLDTEVSAIDTWYRGSPSYEHDAGWFKAEVLRLIEGRRSAPAAQGASDADA